MLKQGSRHVVRRMADKLQSEEGKEIYRQRKKIVEPVFGQVKFNLGFRRFRLRGVEKAGGEWINLLGAQHQESMPELWRKGVSWMT
jgi:transposase